MDNIRASYTRENGVSPPFQSFLYRLVRLWFPVKAPWTFPIKLTPCYLDYIIKKKYSFITSKYIKQFN